MDPFVSAVTLVTESLELTAESGEDLTEIIYDRFYVKCEKAVGLMSQSDDRIRGQMMDQTFILLMDPTLQGDGNYFQWEIANHLLAYEVTADMYPIYLEALCECVSEHLGTRWSDDYANAWQVRMESLKREVQKVDRG